MDSIDLALFDEHEKLLADPRKRAKRAAILAGSTYTRPLRSWCLALRANDKRIDALCPARALDDMDWGDDQPLCAVDEFLVTAEAVRMLCGPVKIPWPGVSVDEAAARFGVNRTTILRWAKESAGTRAAEALTAALSPKEREEEAEALTPALSPTEREWKMEEGLRRPEVRDAWRSDCLNLNATASLRRPEVREARRSETGDSKKRDVARRTSTGRHGAGVRQVGAYVYRSVGRVAIDYYCKGNGRDLHRAKKLVWTPSPVDASGNVWSADWGSVTRDLTRRVPEGWSQRVARTHRILSPGTYTSLLKCPTCARWCLKLLWAQRVWTVAEYLGTAKGGGESATGFACWKCSRVIYESAERGSSPAPGRRVNVWGRFVKRAVGRVGGEG